MATIGEVFHALEKGAEVKFKGEKITHITVLELCMNINVNGELFGDQVYFNANDFEVVE